MVSTFQKFEFFKQNLIFYSNNRNYDLPNSLLEAKKYRTRSVTQVLSLKRMVGKTLQENLKEEKGLFEQTKFIS